eukprot:11566487-Karenia_brevis.AAC.1
MMRSASTQPSQHPRKVDSGNMCRRCSMRCDIVLDVLRFTQPSQHPKGVDSGSASQSDDGTPARFNDQKLANTVWAFATASHASQLLFDGIAK